MIYGYGGPPPGPVAAGVAGADRQSRVAKCNEGRGLSEPDPTDPAHVRPNGATSGQTTLAKASRWAGVALAARWPHTLEAAS
jgi:hypothetical protein